MNPQHRELYADGTLGLLQTPATSRRLDDVKVWALDNGAFTGKYPGDEEFLALLARWAPHRDRCLFVAVPDVLYDADATLAAYPSMANRIRALGYPVALVGQDGMERMPVPWADVDWLFVGGSTEWKLGAGAHRLCEQARAHGVRIHVGRVNSRRRLRYAKALGADSADGTFLAYGPTANLPSLLRWLAELDRQPVLEMPHVTF